MELSTIYTFLMEKSNSALINSMEELEARKLAIREEAKRKIEDAKKVRADEIKALKRVERQVRAREVAAKKKAENHSKILLGIVLIDLANHDAALKAKAEEHARQFFASSASRVESALKGLTLTVTKPESDAWQEDL
jgi:hypothetical protein